LPPADLAALGAEARVRRFREGAPVFTQGTPALRFFLLVEGHLKIMQATPEGQEVIMHMVAPGQFFGLAAALGLDEYPGTALAVVDSAALVWPVSAWDRLAARHPDIVGAALRTVGGHFRDALARLGDVAGARVEQRIARTLLRLVRQFGHRTEAGVEVAFPITRREIAEIACTTLHTVSRVLSGWERAGLLAAGRRRRIVVLDAHGLFRIANDERAGP
jgi:CRP/FNR family transcriptional regulator, nitrogen oxide reductase regulator